MSATRFEFTKRYLSAMELPNEIRDRVIHFVIIIPVATLEIC